MHVKLMTFHTIAVLSLVFASVECNPSGTAYAQSADREDDHEAFNLLLDSIKTHPLREQFSALESFVEDHSEFARGYHTLLDWYIFHDNIQAAKIIFRKRADNPKYARNSRWMLAKIFISENDLDAAYAAFGQALSIASPSFALLRDFVEFDHQQADSDDGAVILEELDLNPDTVRIVSAFQSYYGSKFQQAITLFEKAPRQISHDPTILNTWGYCCHYMSSFSQADSLWRIGVEISNRAGDMRARGRFLLRLGFSQGNRRKYDTALAYYDSAYAVVRLANDLHLMQNLAGYKAYIYRFRGEYSEAEEQFKQAIDISLKTGNIRSLSNWYRGYAMMQYYIGRYQDALTNIDIGEAYARKSNLAGFLVSTKVDKASIYSTLKQDALARQTLQEALELTKINKLRYYEKWTKANLGEIWLRAGEFSKARENFIEFIDYLNETDNPRERLYWVGTIAESYELEGQYLLAKEVYQQAFAAAKEADSKSYQGWYSQKIADMEVLLKNFDAALRAYQQAREIALEQGDSEMLWQILHGIGNAYRMAGKVDSAIAAYTGAVDIIEKTREELRVDQFRIGYFAGGYQVYENLVDCFQKRYKKTGNRSDLDSLFFYVEMGRGRALKTLKFRDAAVHQSAEYLQTRRDLRVLQRRLRREADRFRPAHEWAEVLARLETVRISLLAQRLRMVEDEQTASDQYLEKPTLSKTIQDLQQRGFGLLLYHISEESSFVLVSDGVQVELAQLPGNAHEITALIDSLVTPFHNVEDESLQHTPYQAAVAYRLYQLLVKPAEEVLKLPGKLLLVPDLELNKLPFEILLSEKPDASLFTPSDPPTYADDFLLHRYVLVYSPSTSLLVKRSEAITKDPDVLVFANPVVMASESAHSQLRSRTGWRFDPLVFSEIEADRIKEIHPQTKVYRQEDATKTNFMQEAPQYQVVHLATHASVDTVFDAFSWLVLSAGSDSTDDGLLMGYEIADMDLHCELISLSACETGRGKSVAGEGVLGLPRSFLGAGAKTVLMTLWKVDDKFASELMPEFYDHFLKQKMAKAEALSEAKRLILGRATRVRNNYYQHPFYWASFVLYGDPGWGQRTSSPNILSFTFISISILGLIFAFLLRRSRKKSV